jgi:predicted RNase H-like HicB family nuclease
VKIIFFWSEGDRVFIAEVPELPGCMAHCDTQEAALTEAKETIRLWLHTAREFGDPISAPKGQRLMNA